MTYRQPFKGEYPITQRFGEKITDPKGHTGIDYACPVGTPILASAEGVVMFAGWESTGFGYCVIIRHSASTSTLYAHLQLVKVMAGQTVGQSDVIGLSGNTGNTTGPHLHFEARRIWNVYRRESFDPMTLPLQSVDDSVAVAENATTTQPLEGPAQLGEAVQIVAPAGAWGWNADFSRRVTVFPAGMKLHFTGRTTERLGYTYCECYPEPVKYWVAVHDGTTQILDNQPMTNDQ